MTNSLPPPRNRDLWAYIAPFGLFMLLLAAAGPVKQLGAWLGSSSLAFTAPEFWLYPVQTLLCAAALFWWNGHYPRAFGAGAAAFGALIGLAVFALWISPQAFFHRAPRVGEGFDPTRLLAAGSAEPTLAYYLTVAMRMARLAIVVPILEEVFWRGFLLRYLVREDFTRVPFGTFTWLSFGVVTIGFMLEHSRVDYPAALLTGALYNWVAIRTKSLPACVLAHAVTNLLLGIYVLQTRQWGFW